MPLLIIIEKVLTNPKHVLIHGALLEYCIKNRNSIWMLYRHRFKYNLNIHSVKSFQSKNRDKIYLDAPNPNLKKGCDRDFRAKRAISELYEIFHPINTHNISLVRLKNLYHYLFSDLYLEHPDRFYRDFSIWTVLH